MSARPTPECDVADFGTDDWTDQRVVPADFARRLERQRDAAVEALKDACLTCAAHGEQPPEKWLTVLREIEEGKS